MCRIYNSCIFHSVLNLILTSGASQGKIATMVGVFIKSLKKVLEDVFLYILGRKCQTGLHKMGLSIIFFISRLISLVNNKKTEIFLYCGFYTRISKIRYTVIYLRNSCFHNQQLFGYALYKQLNVYLLFPNAVF